MVVVILVATAMVCVKLVAMSWKGGLAADQTKQVGQAKGAPGAGRTH
jgi:hypothetical protein